MTQAASKRVIAFLTPLAALSPFALGLLLTAASAANEKVDQVQTNKAMTRASLTFTQDSENRFLSAFKLQITRNGKEMVTPLLPIKQLPGESTEADLRVNSADVKVVDLDADGEPEVIVDLALAGAYCCSASFIYGSETAGQYQVLSQFWGNYTSGYWLAGITGKEGDRRLSDLNGDRTLEFISLDDRFRGEFSNYAASAAPVRIWRYQAGKMLDVTRDFPQEVRQGAAAIWRQYQHIRQENGANFAQGAMAAYVGAKLLLGEETDAMQRLNQAYPDQQGKAFKQKLRVFLHQTGYLKAGA